MFDGSPVHTILVVLYYVYPAAVFSYFIVASIISACLVRATTKEAKPKETRSSSTAIFLLSLLYILTFAGQLAVITVKSIVSHQWPTEDHIIIGHLSCILIFGVLLSRYPSEDDGLPYPCLGSWTLALLFELAIIGLSVGQDTLFVSNVFGIVNGVLIIIRCLVFLSLIGICTISRAVKPAVDEEREPLLPKDSATSPTTSTNQSQQSQESGYGSTVQANDTTAEEQPEYSWERREREAKEAMKKRLEEGGSWIEYVKGFKVCASVYSTLSYVQGLPEHGVTEDSFLTAFSSFFLMFGPLETSISNFVPLLFVFVSLQAMHFTYSSLVKLELLWIV